MVMPHFKYDLIKRSQNCNILATLSYQSRSTIRDYSDNNILKKSYTHTEDLVESKLFLPEGSPKRYKNHEVLWNEINEHCNDRLIIRCQLPKQREMSYEHFIECANRFFYLSGGQYNCPYEYFVHKHKNTNDNDHIHGMIALNPIIDGEIGTKSKKVYLDENDNEIKMVDDCPVLTRNGQVKYNADGSIKFKKGYQKLDLDINGNIQYDENGKVKIKDIRVALYDDNGNRIYYNNGKYKKPAYKEAKVRFTGLETLKDFTNEKGYRYEARMLWQNCINEIYRKYNYRDKDGNLIQVDLRSYEEQDRDKPEHEKRLAGEHIGHDPGSEIKVERNEIRKKINAGTKLQKIPYEDLKNEYEKKQASRKAAQLSAALQKNQVTINKIEQMKEKNWNDQLSFFKQMNPRKRFIDFITKRLNKKTPTVIEAAGKQYDRLNNAERVTFIYFLYGKNVATIAAKVMQQTNPDQSNAPDGLIKKDVSKLFNFDIPETLTEKVTGIIDKIRKPFTRKKPQQPTQSENNNRIDLDRENNLEFYLHYPLALEGKAQTQAKEAQKIINYSELVKDYTKNNYYAISDTSKIFKEILIIKIMKKTNKTLKEIDKLRSKEFESFCKNNGLKKDFNVYHNWLTKAQDYWQKLPEPEKAKPGRPAFLSKPFVTTPTSKTSTTTTTPASGTAKGTEKVINETNKSKQKSNVITNTKTPNVTVKWTEKENHELSEQEKREKETYRDWNPVIQPPPSNKDDDKKR